MSKQTQITPTAIATALGIRELSVPSMTDAAPPPRDYIFNAWALSPGTYGLLYAPGGSGKSYVAMTMLLTLALAGVRGANYDPLGINPKQAPEGTGWQVMYVTGEDNDEEVWRRVYRLTERMGPEAIDAVKHNLFIVSTQGVAPRVLISDGKVQQYMIARSAERRLTVFDTLTRFHDAEENSNNDMAGVVACFERIAHESKAAVLVAHHCSKSAQAEGNGSGLAIRGASCIRDNARWALGMSRDAETGSLRLVEDKHNDGRRNPDIHAQWTKGGTIERTWASASAVTRKDAQKYRNAKNGEHTLYS